jgi:hypothetical protein
MAISFKEETVSLYRGHKKDAISIRAKCVCKRFTESKLFTFLKLLVLLRILYKIIETKNPLKSGFFISVRMKRIRSSSFDLSSSSFGLSTFRVYLIF